MLVIIIGECGDTSKINPLLYCKKPYFSATQDTTVIKQIGLTVEKCLKKMQTEWQTSADPDCSSFVTEKDHLKS